ncbi:dihydrodipicolinate synthase family protein [Mesorhizobium sp. B2-1-8]|uniref:dihydrodipicolinate synthase family protein n=1 Tax=unclassified Mesorhizobium TaxID=325217 RepID=UPI001128A9BC|nr:MULTISPECIES: dihydrodipicolinate synthase family protein [unclassified Mesorhizobium]MBZ9672665.1 dihydrodipicolinate synthase family protein [Mesorhizobium sp. ES1-3]UCI19197.1 dihydrodipicolinate synthase family protein [Mesorhizobium sp. B2-1-8]
MKLRGVMPALVTPFGDDGKIDFKQYEKLLNKLRNDGVKGWVPCGSTGEYNAMTSDERASVLKFVADFANKDELLIAGTNAGSTWEVIEHTRRARDLGYDTVLLSAPFYATPAPNELIGHYRSVLDAVDVDIVVYNYPPKVGVEVGLDVLDAFVDEPRILGIKESSGNLLRAIDIRSRYGSRYQVTNGSDDQTLDFYLWGATSWICGPANCMAKACVDLVNTIEGGDWLGARDMMQVIYGAMSSLETGKFVQKVKYGCELAGTPVGLGRKPLLALTDEEKSAFRKAIEPVIG